MCKKPEHVESCFFTNINLLPFLPFSLPSPSLLPKLPFVVILKFCYHGNVTSHFSSLLPEKISLRENEPATGPNCTRQQRQEEIFKVPLDKSGLSWCCGNHCGSLLCCDVGIVECLFNFLRSFGDCTRPRHGETSNKSLNKSAKIALKLYM